MDFLLHNRKSYFISTLLIFLLTQSVGSAQCLSTDSTITFLVHVQYSDFGWSSNSTEAQIDFTYKDSISGNVKWQIFGVNPLENDSSGYLVKLSIPKRLYPIRGMITCVINYYRIQPGQNTENNNLGLSFNGGRQTGLTQNRNNQINWTDNNNLNSASTINNQNDIVHTDLSGVNLLDYKVSFKSTISNIDVSNINIYMIPCYIWDTRIKNTSWKQNISSIDFWKVNGTEYHIGDLTNYVIVFVNGNKFGSAIVKPNTLQKGETVSITFDP